MNENDPCKIKPFFVMEIMEKAQEMEKNGESIIHLEIGEPDFETPECVKEAAIRAIQSGKTKYTHSQGILELREAVAAHYHEKYHVSISPKNITISSGTSAAMSLAYLAILQNRGKVIIPDPTYPCYAGIIQSAGGEVVSLRTNEKTGFQYEMEKLKIAVRDKKVKAIMINSPANPTGHLTPADTIKKIIALGKTVVSDEIYHGLVYGEKEHSVLEFTDNAFIVNGFSKLYAMTGWRLGYVISPEEETRLIQKLHQNLYISTNSFVQWAGIAALKESGPEIKKMVEEYKKRRIVLLKGLKKLGFEIPVEPVGAFYVLVNAKHLSSDSLALAGEILEKAKVAVTPGIDFGPSTEGYLRFSYTSSVEKIEEGLNRMEKFFKSRK